MNSLYDSMARAKNAENGVAEEASEDEAGWSFGATLVEALESVRTNLADLGGALLDPAGIHVDDLSDTAAAAEEQEVAVDTIDMMQQLFGGGFAAFCYLLMVLLYMPCGAAVATVWREAGTAWTLFLCGWTTALGYTSATIVYRLGTFAEKPDVLDRRHRPLRRHPGRHAPLDAHLREEERRQGPQGDPDLRHAMISAAVRLRPDGSTAPQAFPKGPAVARPPAPFPPHPPSSLARHEVVTKVAFR